MRVEPWLARAARAHPERAAVETAAGSWSYAELERRAGTGAAALRERGVLAGDRVAIALPGGLAFAQALHAAWRIGAVAVPIDTRLGPDERAQVLGGAKALVDAPLGDREELDGTPHHLDARLGDRGAAEAVSHEMDAPAAVIHTSGTTSAARPVELTHGNLLWSALGSAVALGLHPRERWLCTLPVAHVGGLSILARSAIYGTTAVVHERFDAGAAAAAITSDAITLVSVVPTTLQRLLDAGLAQPPALRCALVGGGPVPPALLERAQEAGVPVSQTYGLTEACSQVSTASPGGAGAGPTLFCTRVRIGHDREILVAGPTVAPAVSGWLYTGDIGRLDERGDLYVLGRLADTIVSGGENVAPAEVEAVLVAHPAVAEAGVYGRADPGWGEAVTAAVVMRGGQRVGAEELRSHCAARLAGFKVPKAFVFHERLPRTASGKLLRAELGERHCSDSVEAP